MIRALRILSGCALVVGFLLATPGLLLLLAASHVRTILADREGHAHSMIPEP